MDRLTIQSGMNPDSTAERYSKLLNVLDNQVHRYPSRDSGIGAYAQATLIKLEKNVDSRLENIVHETLELRQSMSSSDLATLALKSVTKQAIHGAVADESFPEGYVSHLKNPKSFRSVVGKWLDLYDNILDSTEAQEEFTIDMYTRKTSANYPERYVGPEFVLQLYDDRFPDGVDVLDVGCSLNLGLYRMSDEAPPFLPVKFAGSQNKLKSALRERLGYKVPLVRKVGLDAQARDSGQVPWAIANRFQPKERLNRERVDTYTQQVYAAVTNLPGIRADFTADKLDVWPKSADLKESSFDALMFITMMYQLSPAERVKAMKNAHKYLRPGGIIIIQDFCILDPSTPMGLTFLDDWRSVDNPYRTYVFDSLRPQAGFQELFRFSDERTRRMRLGSGQVYTGGKTVNVKEALLKPLA